MVSSSESEVDISKHYVRIRGYRKKFVEFDFAIGSPDLAMEMIMPKAIFNDFCDHYQVIMIGQEESDALDAERAEWRYGTIDAETTV